MLRVLDNILCDLVKAKGHIMYVIVNASPPKQLDVATANFACA